MRCDPLCTHRRTLHTGADLLNDKQGRRPRALLVDDAHAEIETTWGIYQRMIQAYRDTDRAGGRELMATIIDAISTDVPAALVEVATLGRTLKKRAADVLAYFDPHQQRPHRSHQRPDSNPARIRPRLPQPHQLQRRSPC